MQYLTVHVLPGRKLFKSRATGATVLVAALAAAMSVTLVGGAAAAAHGVPLGTANRFAVLAGAGITNTGPTTVTGDLGTYPTTTMTGVGSLTINGTNHAGDAVTQQAKADLVTGYNTAAGEGPTSPITADLGGQNLSPGVYNSASSIGLTGTLILDAHGKSNATFVFQAGSTLTTASASSVKLVNGARACNVYWQVGSSATLGTGSSFRGSILAKASITVTTGTTVHGRVLARNGAVTLDTDTIHISTCAAVHTHKGHKAHKGHKGHKGSGGSGTARPPKRPFGLTG
ncbi:MAG TPA: ice-binding family protein [Gaiellaceae bacterium]|nr:ice-binding family protein [Gaiellaceae bacterium]